MSVIDEVAQRQIDYFRQEGPRVCWECAPAHVENCPQCFGWGLRMGRDGREAIGITAALVPNVRDKEWTECPVCGGRPEYVSQPRTPALRAGLETNPASDHYALRAFGAVVKTFSRVFLVEAPSVIYASLKSASEETDPELRSLKCATVSLPGMEEVGDWRWVECQDGTAVRYVLPMPAHVATGRIVYADTKTREAKLRRAVVAGWTFLVARAEEIRTVYYTKAEPVPETTNQRGANG